MVPFPRSLSGPVLQLDRDRVWLSRVGRSAGEPTLNASVI
jgi:hypothetical protein